MNEVWYTAREQYDDEYKVELAWEKYIEWSKLTQLKELVSLDGMLNGLSFEPKFDSEDDWQFIVTETSVTQFFKSLDYVIKRTEELVCFNLLAVIQEPKEQRAELDGEFEFVGYDLIETDGDISALTNCGGFDESFLPTDLNEYGLLSSHKKGIEVQESLRKNNPEEHHANCHLYEVWRHKSIGRKKSNKQ